MKRLFFFLIVVILLQNNCIVYAGETQENPPLTGKAGENITWTFDPDMGALSLTGTGNMYNWKGGDDRPPWYVYYRTSIKSLSISKGITSIGVFAFHWIENLTQVTIPASVVSVKDYAFMSCYSLAQVNLQEGVSSIGGDAFAFCSSLQTITLPASLTSLDSMAFHRSEALREINAVAGNRKFSSVNGVLYNKSGTELLRCPTMTGRVFEIPDGVTRIGWHAFDYCQNLKEIRFSDQLSEIASYAFEDCIGLTSVAFPESLSVIGRSAFFGCTSLASVVLPSNLTSIGDYAFKNCAPADTFTVYGLPGTYAETYAAANGYSFAVTEQDHQYGGWVVKTAATCTGRGVAERTCSICGRVDTKTIPAKGHVPVSDPAVAATCTSKGKTLGSHCSVCGAVLTPQKTIAAMGHKWGRFTVSKAATALTKGIESRTCSICKAKDTRKIAELTATAILSSSTIMLYEGESIDKVKLSGMAAGDGVLQWHSSNRKVAVVSSKGVITAVNAGNANINVILKSGLGVSIKVKVLKQPAAKTIKAKKIKGLKKNLTIKKGKKITLKPKLWPKNSTSRISYKSSNKKIATVSAKGVIKAKKAGTVKITVKSGKAKFVIKVKVKK